VSFANSREEQRLLQDADALGALATIATAQALHRREEGRFAATLDELGEAPAVAGVAFELVTVDDGWVAWAMPDDGAPALATSHAGRWTTVPVAALPLAPGGELAGVELDWTLDRTPWRVAQPRWARATRHVAEGRWRESIAPGFAAQFLAPRVATMNAVGKALLELRLWPECEAALERALAQHARSPEIEGLDAGNNLGICLRERSREAASDEEARALLARAIEALTRVTSKAEGYEEAWTNLGLAHAWLGQRSPPEERRSRAREAARVLQYAQRLARSDGAELSEPAARALAWALENDDE
jgi:hypothetical protein